jgi:adenylate kinase
MLNIILFGAPGAGKGTQAELLKNYYGLAHISTGEMLRSEAAAGTPLGKSIQDLINAGMFVSDEIIMNLIASKIAANKTIRGFIFDGVPRTAVQARLLDDMLNANGLSITAVISLKVSENELTMRILNRGAVSGRNDDKDEGIIRERIQLYHRKTEPLHDYYKNSGKFFSVSGTGNVEDIFETLCGIIDNFAIS